MAASNPQHESKVNAIKSPFNNSAAEFPETPIYSVNKYILDDDILERRSALVSPCICPASNYQRVPDSGTSILKFHQNALLSSAQKLTEEDKADSEILVLNSGYANLSSPYVFQSSR